MAHHSKARDGRARPQIVIALGPLAAALLSSCTPAPPEKASDAPPDWVLQRATTSGACHVKTAPSFPNLGVELARKPSRRAICEEALSRHSDDAADSQKCLEYTRGAIDECRRENVTLP